MDVPAYLRAARGMRGVSQRQLAEIAGVPRSTLDRIEAGTTDPKVSTVAKLFGALGYFLAVATDPGRPLELDETREGLIDGRGRHFPPHWRYDRVTEWDGWWGWYRKRRRGRQWIPKYTYWKPTYLSDYLPTPERKPWEDAT